MAFVKKLFEDLDFAQPRPISRLFLKDPVDFGVSEADVPKMKKKKHLIKMYHFLIQCLAKKNKMAFWSIYLIKWVFLTKDFEL